ncbi:FKBP-type peptidyl-prolyl cis-trans isomerase [Utexia brackfieldae]|uniref:FKBP-type peptidyl-prolyl cis-trans isomerase n=1 Tax=Utexia brackfieldae TaxID=3074108 RepID=UPI00370DD738
MKSLMKMTLIGSVVVLALTGCNEKNAVTEPAAISTPAQKEAYAMGSSFSTYLKRSLESQKIQVDNDYLIKGFTETYLGKGQMTTEEIDKTLNDLGKRIQDENKARIEKEAADSIAAGDKFRADFAAQDGVKKTKSGLLYKVITPGNDTHPTSDDIVVVDYSGKLVDGREFDSSYSRNEPATFPVSYVIKGWSEGIQLIGEGGEIQLVVPPELAYGEQSLTSSEEGKASVPSQATLVFDVKLLSVEKTPAADEDKDSAAPAQAVKPAAKK